MSTNKSRQPTFADVLLPLAIPRTYTYAVPIDMVSQITFGIRVEVPLKNKLYSGIVIKVHKIPPAVSKPRLIISVLDEAPIIHVSQFQFWEWLASYYCANLGEVMNVALPSGLKLSSESKFILNAGIDTSNLDLSDDEFLVTEALTIQSELTGDVIKDILDKKTIYPVIKSLMEKRVLSIKEELKYKYKPRIEDFVSVLSPYVTDVDLALDLVKRSDKQGRAILSILALAKKNKHVSKKSVYEMADVDNSVIKALEKKGIIQITAKEVSRINLSELDELHKLDALSEDQESAIEQVREGFEESKVVLLHGITGSGKTRIYVELILEVLAQGGQALLLLPEIALTNQIVSRLKTQIGEQLYVFHSKINDQQRVEIWNAAMFANKLFVGARSALYLPFSDLKLIIVDEEHDPSYKQDSPNPKYQGRDSAIMLGKLLKANVLLGSATPSLESILNSRLGKYRYVQLESRYGEAVLPAVEIIDMKAAYKKGLMRNGFSVPLLDAIQETVAQGEQVILFQNRRGYAPVQRCNFCAWTAECPNCDVTLTFHQAINDLKCHYCGYRQRKSDECPACGNHEMSLIGTGTQRIEEALQEQLPELRIARFDYDTTRTKGNQEKILFDFESHHLDVLVGTQMITKGFDFEKISLVGILSADSLLSYPDFRAAERSFQLLVQVSGRAGRRKKPGKVMIQAFKKDHPVLKDVLDNNTTRFYERELAERKEFIFPPYFYLISIWLRHVDFQKTKSAAKRMAALLSSRLGKRVQGPVDPSIIRVRNQYQQVIYVRIEKEGGKLFTIKQMILKAAEVIKSEKEIRQVKISIDVDPY